MKPLVTLMDILPQNFLSWLTGVVVRLEPPGALNRLINGLFVSIFGIDMRDASRTLSEYRSVEDVFTRQLKPGARPVQGEICSPADGKLTLSMPVSGGDQAVQVKGINYSLKDLVWAEDSPSKEFSPSWFTTVYLAPHNYHRVHSPLTGILREIRYVPGKLWPVNQTFTGLVPGLFTQNERLIFELEVPGKGVAYIVMVGAFNVGRMTTPFWSSFATNDWQKQNTRNLAHTQKIRPGQNIKAGDELGTFMLGSTVVIVYNNDLAGNINLTDIRDSCMVRMGQSLGSQDETDR